VNELALYPGLGAPLASILCGWRTVAYVEHDAYCVRVLLERIEEGHIPAAPIWDDARTFDGRPWRDVVDIVTAGFPCQPFSVAGRRQGESDERNLWPDTLRIIREVGPRYVFLENVPGLLSSGYFGTIFGDLAESGFDAEWGVLSAAAVGAPHLRKRLWILADSEGVQRERLLGSAADRVLSENVPDPVCVRRHGRQDDEGAEAPCGGRPEAWSSGCGWWSSEPGVGRLAHGVAHRVDRLRALGNGWVPAVAAGAWRELMRRARERT